MNRIAALLLTVLALLAPAGALRGDSTKAYQELGWRHTRTFAQIAEEMVAYDVRIVREPQALWHET